MLAKKSEAGVNEATFGFPPGKCSCLVQTESGYSTRLAVVEVSSNEAVLIETPPLVSGGYVDVSHQLLHQSSHDFVQTFQNEMLHAIREGSGIGFVARRRGNADPSLTEVMPPLEEWSPQLWVVTHVDLHRTAKVQAFVNYLKEAVKLAEDKGA